MTAALAPGAKMLVFDGQWEPYRGLLGAVMKSRPITEEDARELMGGEPLPPYDPKID